MRVIGLFAVILMSLGGGSIFAYEFQKCSPAISYWYNYYYDPGALLKAKIDSSLHSPVSDTTLLSGKYISDKDSVFAPKSDSANPPIKPEKPTELPAAPIEYSDNDALPYDDYLIIIIDSILYIEAQMTYEGDISFLESLGVKVFMKGTEGGLGVLFPLSILPQLDSLSSMIMIIRFPKLKDNYFDTSELDSQ